MKKSKIVNDLEKIQTYVHEQEKKLSANVAKKLVKSMKDLGVEQIIYEEIQVYDDNNYGKELRIVKINEFELVRTDLYTLCDEVKEDNVKQIMKQITSSDHAERLAMGVEYETEEVFTGLEDSQDIDLESQFAGICYLLECDFNDLQTLIATVFNLPKDHYPEGYITE